MARRKEKEEKPRETGYWRPKMHLGEPAKWKRRPRPILVEEDQEPEVVTSSVIDEVVEQGKKEDRENFLLNTDPTLLTYHEQKQRESLQQRNAMLALAEARNAARNVGIHAIRN